MARMAGPTASGAWPSVSSRSVRGTALPWPFSSLPPSPCSCFMQFIWPVVLSYLNVTNGLFMIAIIVFAGLLGLLLSMMMRRQQTREQAHERMLERQEHHAQTLDYASQVHDRISGRLANIAMICSRHIGERGTLLTWILAMSRIGDWWHLRWPIHWRMLTPSSSSCRESSGAGARLGRTRYPLIGCVDYVTLFEKSLPARDSMEGSRCTTMDSWKTSTPII